jgi:hypothetical protein
LLEASAATVYIEIRAVIGEIHGGEISTLCGLVDIIHTAHFCMPDIGMLGEGEGEDDDDVLAAPANEVEIESPTMPEAPRTRRDALAELESYVIC